MNRTGWILLISVVALLGVLELWDILAQNEALQAARRAGGVHLQFPVRHARGRLLIDARWITVRDKEGRTYPSLTLAELPRVVLQLPDGRTRPAGRFRYG